MILRRESDRKGCSIRVLDVIFEGLESIQSPRKAPGIYLVVQRITVMKNFTNYIHCTRGLLRTANKTWTDHYL